MKTANAMQLKARIKKQAELLNVSPQLMMQDYLLERLLERLSLSPWRDKMILKGGLLIASLIGIASRTTKDLDTTITGFTLTHESAEKAFREICGIALDDDLYFEIVRTEDIRETDDYPGIRVFIKAHYPPLNVPLSVDVTTGDVVTPSAVEYSYPLTFDDRVIHIMAYPIETVMAEKLETVLSRSIANTRPRDYYDIVKIWTIKRDAIDINTLRRALRATAKKRGSENALLHFASIIDLIANDHIMQARWKTYCRDYRYVGDLGFDAACRVILGILEAIMGKDS